VYGTGAAKELYFTPPQRSAPSTYQKAYTPGLVIQLQSQLQARDARDAERDEEIRKMKEQMDVFNSFLPIAIVGGARKVRILGIQITEVVVERELVSQLRSWLFHGTLGLV